MGSKELNLAEILKDAPKGTILYSPLIGECSLVEISGCVIRVATITANTEDDEYELSFWFDGTYYNKRGECLLFPSKDNRDWSSFKTGVKTEKEPVKDDNDVNEKDCDLELYAHFYRYIDYMIGDICYVDRDNYTPFVAKLPIKKDEAEFNATVGQLGCIKFDINSVSHFFKDFPRFKKVIKNEFRFDSKAGHSNQ